MILDEAVESFRENPTSDTAKYLSDTVKEYHKDGMIEADTAMKYFDEIDSYYWAMLCQSEFMK